MTGYDRRLRLLAAGLSGVAGYVDAIGFISLGGFFVSFMSGNTTRAGIGLTEGGSAAALALGLIALFVLGVILGAVVGRLAKARRRPMVLAWVSALLATAALLAPVSPQAAAVLMVLAMGGENAVFAEDGDVRVGVTYMTGALVKLGKRITAALFGGDRLAWIPYLALWFGLFVGAALGAFAYGQVGLQALWGAALAAAGLGAAAAWIGQDAPGAPSGAVELDPTSRA